MNKRSRRTDDTSIVENRNNIYNKQSLRKNYVDYNPEGDDEILHVDCTVATSWFIKDKAICTYLNHPSAIEI